VTALGPVRLFALDVRRKGIKPLLLQPSFSVMVTVQDVWDDCTSVMILAMERNLSLSSPYAVWDASRPL
jgi:hypothetical protein